MKTLIIILSIGASQAFAEQNMFNQVFKDWTRPHYSSTETMPQGPSMDSIYNERVRAMRPQQNNTYIIKQQPQKNGFGGFGNFGDKDDE